MADNLQVTPGSGATVATDEVGGVHVQRVKPTFGEDGTATDVSATTPMPVTDNATLSLLDRLNYLLTTLINLMLAPLGYDKTIQRQRGTVIVESGTVTTCSTVTTCATVTTVNQLSGLDARPMWFAASNQAWALTVRSRIS